MIEQKLFYSAIFGQTIQTNHIERKSAVMLREKTIRFICIAVLSTGLGIFSGCGQNTKQAEGDKNVSFTYWCGMGGDTASVLSSFNDMEIYKKFQEMANIEIIFRHPPAGQASEQFNLMVASRDLPDLVEYSWQSYPGGAQKAINDGIIRKLNEYVNKHSPNFRKLLTDNDTIRKQTETDDDSMYAFPAIGLNTIRVSTGFFVRQDWLDELGLKRPETIDELTAMLKAFKNGKGANSAITGTGQNIFSNEYLNGAFNVGCKFYLDNGTVKYGPIENGYRDYIETLRKWYADGLLDPDFFANNSKDIEKKVVSGNSGVVFGGIGSTMGGLINAMSNKDKNFKLAAIQFPVKNKGEQPKFFPYAWDVRPEGMLAISTANKNPEKSAEFADLFYSEEGNLLKNFGISGLTYTLDNNYPKYTDLILHNKDGLSVSQALSKYTRATLPSPGLIDPRYHEQYYQIQEQKDAMKLWNEIADSALSVTMPQVTPTQEESEELSSISSNINAFLEEQVMKIVMGVAPMEDFDVMVTKLKKMGAQRAVEIYQNAYERYQKR